MRIRKKTFPETWLRSYYRPYTPFFFGSGTQALAAALCALSRLRPGRRNVLIPGYTCPSLVSSVRFAGCRAVPVDLEPDRPRLDLGSLEQQLDETSLAVVGVDLFGIPEQYAGIAALARANGAWVIEDAAQRKFLPPYSDSVDLVVVSYGRGKPATVLEGGALLLRSSELVGPVGSIAERLGSPGSGAVLRRYGKALAYNLLRHPSIYWLPSSLPFLGLGRTDYHGLKGIEPMSPGAMGWLPANLSPDSNIEQSAGQRRLGEAALGWGRSVQDVAEICRAGGEPLSRMPLLAASAGLRSRLVRRLRPFGASAMYPAPVVDIPGAFPGKGKALSGRLPNATDFATRLFTLPLHEWMDANSVSAINAAVRRELDPDAVAEVIE